ADDIRDVPNTEEKARLKSLSLRPTLMWLEMILQQGEIPPYDESPWTEEGLVIEKSLPFDSYKQFCSEHGKRPDPQHRWGNEPKNRPRGSGRAEIPPACQRQARPAQVQVRPSPSVP